MFILDRQKVLSVTVSMNDVICNHIISNFPVAEADCNFTNQTVLSRPSRSARDPGLHGGGDDPAGADGDAHLRLARRKPPRRDRLVQERRRRRLLIHHLRQGRCKKQQQQITAKICSKPCKLSNKLDVIPDQVWGCSHVTSANFWDFGTPSPLSLSNSRSLSY